VKEGKWQQNSTVEKKKEDVLSVMSKKIKEKPPTEGAEHKRK